MNIIKKQNPFQTKSHKTGQEETTKMVGAYIPESLSNELRLLSIYHEKPLQTIIKEVLRAWWIEEGIPTEQIITELVDRAVTEWKRRRSEGTKNQQDFINYLAELEDRLIKKKIRNRDRELMLTQVENRIAQEWENEKN